MSTSRRWSRLIFDGLMRKSDVWNRNAFFYLYFPPTDSGFKLYCHLFDYTSLWIKVAVNEEDDRAISALISTGHEGTAGVRPKGWAMSESVRCVRVELVAPLSHEVFWQQVGRYLECIEVWDPYDQA